MTMLAGPPRFEQESTALEAGMLPLHQGPMEVSQGIQPWTSGLQDQCSKQIELANHMVRLGGSNRKLHSLSFCTP